MTSADLPGLQLTSVQTWLAAQDVGLDTARPLQAELFTGGRSNVTYRLTDAHDHSVVLRRPPLGNVMPTAHDMAREFRVLTGLSQAGFPAPTALALCEDEKVNGAPFLVMEFVDDESSPRRTTPRHCPPSKPTTCQPHWSTFWPTCTVSMSPQRAFAI